MFLGQQDFSRQLKNRQLDKLSAKIMKTWTKCVFCAVLIEQ